MKTTGLLTAFLFTTSLVLTSGALGIEQESPSAGMTGQEITTDKELKRFSLQDQQGQNLGQVDQVLADVQHGKIGYIISTSQQQPDQKHAIPWDALQVDSQQQTLTLQMSSEQFQQAPSGDAQIVQDVNQARQIDEFFNVSPQWGEIQQPQVKALEEFGQFPLQDQQGQNIGQIEQVLVDVQQGQIAYVIATTELQPESERVIPWNALSADPQQQALTVQISVEQFLQAPTGDEQMVKDEGLTQQLHQFYGVAPYWETQQIAAQLPQQPQQPQHGQQMTPPQPEQVTTADSLKRFTLQDQQGQNLGQVSQVIVDVQNGVIGYVIATTEQQPGSERVIPWNAVTVDPQQQTLTVQISAEQFLQAPTGDEQMVKDENLTQQLHQFYGVAPYWEAGTAQ